MNQTLAELKVEQHPDKTFIGRVERGFMFLGYQITATGVVGLAASCWEGFQERVLRLYEQNALPEVIRQRIGEYVRRWKRWAVSGIRNWADLDRPDLLFAIASLPLPVPVLRAREISY